MGAAVAGRSDAVAHEPAALMPQWAARLLGFAALASLGALEWQRLVAGLSSGRALLWVLAGVATAAAVVACDRVDGRSRAAAVAGAAAGGLLAGFAASGLRLALLGPRHWGDLASGVGGGLRSLGTVRLPYEAVDPWPALALELVGAELIVLAALLAFWPRERGRGYPFLSLAALLVLVASPVVSLGGTRPLALGAVLAALTVCFLWLERLPLRPGLGVAALLGLALAGALPLASVADRGEPWFDYQSFAEALGPNDPVRFSWAQGYGPITWPRDGNEVLRVASSTPSYWKARDLDRFDGRGWAVLRTAAPVPRGYQAWEPDLPEDWRDRPAWTSTLKVTLRRIRTSAVIGAGTIVSVTDSSHDVRPGVAPGTWDSDGDMRRGDSYTVEVHAPKPDGAQLSQASSGTRGQKSEDLVFDVPFKPGAGPRIDKMAASRAQGVLSAEIHVPAFGSGGSGYATYPSINRSEYDVDSVMRRSLYARTWRLAQRLLRGAKSPFDYIVRVNHFLQGPDFRYSERPTPPPPGRAPLDAFLFDTHEGYCQHYAGAMALLLRMGGVPARVATGFSPGGYSKRHQAWIVRDTDAHAWVEAWFDRYGWVTFDPTPDATPARSQIAALVPPPPPAPASSSQAGGAGAAGGGAGRNPRSPLRGDLRFDPLRGAVDEPVGGGGVAWWAWALGGALAALLLTWVALAWRRRRGRRGQTSLDRAIFELEEALRRSGRPLAPGTTLRQLERFLGGSPEVVAYLRALSAGRYAASSPTPPPSGRRAVRRALSEGLGPAGRIRALWALPPRVR